MINIEEASDYISNYLDPSKSLCSGKTYKTKINGLEIIEEDYY